MQTASGFLVDRFGPRPILFAGLGLIGLAAMGYASSTSYAMLAVSAIVGGIGNGVFHPVDYTLLNRKIHPVRLGHAYSVHGITGSLGWALAPAMLVPITLLASWRVALVCAGALAWAGVAAGVAQARAACARTHGEEAHAPMRERVGRPPSGRRPGLSAHSRGLDVFRVLLFLRHGAQRDPGLCARGGAPSA